MPAGRAWRAHQGLLGGFRPEEELAARWRVPLRCSPPQNVGILARSSLPDTSVHATGETRTRLSRPEMTRQSQLFRSGCKYWT